MPVKKSEVYSSLWKSCDELRGGMDASQYKDYILVLLFVKYVSDRYAGKSNALIEVPQGGSFADMVALIGKPEIGDGINKIIAKLAEPNDLKGVIDVADFNDSDKLGKGKEMQDKLSKLVAIFENPELDFSKNRVENDDILGDAYEYLMRNFATESGKSKGQFYTPAEVSRIMAKVIGIKTALYSQTVYDMTCGSGSLLLKAAAETEHGISIYGQEMDVATRGLAKMNMILHNHPTADIQQGNTLSKPLFKNKDETLKTFDYAVANPPFSTKSWTNGLNLTKDEFGRFEGFGIPPAKNGDFAFLLHMLKSLKSTGKGAIILPHGVLFRGNSEAEIRKNIIKRGYIKGIIGLPPNLFYGTGIPACIIVLDKENASNRKGIFIIDASNGFVKDGNKNRLREQDVHKIVDTFNKQLETPKYSRMVPTSEIADSKNDYNLNIPRYIDGREEEDLQDIEAHLKGGIPNKDIDDLSRFWNVCPSLRNMLFMPSERAGYSIVKVEQSKINPVIYENPDFSVYKQKVNEVFESWQNQVLPKLRNLSMGSKPKALIIDLSEGLLQAFSQIELIDNYDIYQNLMTYWAETMQDDAYIIAANGWKVEISLIKNKNGKQTGWDCDLIPKNLVINKYLVKEQENIDKLTGEGENLARQIQTLKEENSGEDDLLAEVKNDSGNIPRAEITKRLREIGNNNEFIEEVKILQEYLDLLEQETEINNKKRDAELDLDKKLINKYKSLTEEETKILGIENKWLHFLFDSIKNEVETTAQNLAGRIKVLSERYDEPIPKVADKVDELSKKVDNHLKSMGFKW
ncbi:MAG: type I restriction-modification system subunit M [Candidatus Bathyarchaeia archaeon]